MIETTASVLYAMPSTRTQLDTFVHKTVEMVDAGLLNALELKAQLKFIEKAIEEIDKQTKDQQLRELSKHPKGPVEMMGFKIEPMEAGTKYDYESTGDTVWQKLKWDAEVANKALSDRQKFLQSIKQPMTIVDESTGEVVTINPPVKSSVSSIKYTML